MPAPLSAVHRHVVVVGAVGGEQLRFLGGGLPCVALLGGRGFRVEVDIVLGES